MFPADERNAFYDQAKLLLREFDKASLTPAVQSGDPPEVTVRVEEDCRTAEQAKTKRDVFSEWEDETEDNDKDEVQRYTDSQFAWNGEDLLSFWRLQKSSFPMLAKVARMILCISASSAASERVFSSAGRVLEARHNRLNPGAVDAILFLHSKRACNTKEQEEEEAEEKKKKKNIGPVSCVVTSHVCVFPETAVVSHLSVFHSYVLQESQC